MASSSQQQPAIKGGNAEDRTTLTALAGKWMTAYAAGDIATLMTFYDGDTRMMPEGLSNFRGPDQIRAYFKEGIEAASLRVENRLEEIEINGSDAGAWAYLSGVFAAEATPRGGGDVMYVGGRYFILLRKADDGRWVVLRDIDNATKDADALIEILKSAKGNRQ